MEPDAGLNRLALASLRANAWANAGVQLHSAGAGLAPGTMQLRGRLGAPGSKVGAEVPVQPLGALLAQQAFWRFVKVTEESAAVT